MTTWALATASTWCLASEAIRACFQASRVCTTCETNEETPRQAVWVASPLLTTQGLKPGFRTEPAVPTASGTVLSIWSVLESPPITLRRSIAAEAARAPRALVDQSVPFRTWVQLSRYCPHHAPRPLLHVPREQIAEVVRLRPWVITQDRSLIQLRVTARTHQRCRKFVQNPRKHEFRRGQQRRWRCHQRKRT